MMFDKLFEKGSNYHTGEGTLLNGLPWITPGSIYRIEELLCGEVPWTFGNGDQVNYDWSTWKAPKFKSDFKVLEFGAGGSTVFFAKRCGSVESFEYNASWVQNVNRRLQEDNLTNTEITECTDGNEMLSYIDELPDEHFDVLLVDNDWKIIDRDAVLVKAIPKLKKDKALIVLDNYGSPACFPQSHLWSMDEFIATLLDDEWQGEEFNSIWWGGLGTRIFFKGFFDRHVIKENAKGSARWFKI